MIPALIAKAAAQAEALRQTEAAVAEAVVTAVSAEIPVSWSGFGREAVLADDDVTIGVAWSERGWHAYATGPSVVEDYVVGLVAETPTRALADLERRLARATKPWRVAAYSIVVRLRRGVRA